MVEIIGSISAAVGFALSAFIYKKKLSPKPLICPLRGNCNVVLGSRFSKTLGVRNELLGMTYYLSVWVLYALKLLHPEIVTGEYHLFLMALTTIGFLFSVYLTAVQAFVLKSWCTWCVATAFCNIALFVSLFAIPLAPVAAILAAHKSVALLAHTAGFILGVGAATITDILFFKFLKDRRISSEEKGTLDTLTNIIWAALTILVLSGAALYLGNIEELNSSAKFLLKTIVVGVILVNGFLLNLKVAPYMTQLSFDRAPEPTRLRRLAFALGGVSVTSWYLAFFLGSMRSIAVNFGTGLILYAGLLVCAIIVSQIIEKTMTNKVARESTIS